MTISVLLADDQPLLRRGFRMILEAEGDLTVVAEAGDGEEAVEQARRHVPDVVLMDIRMPGTDGIEATRRITAADERVRVLVLTTFDLDEYAFGAARAGASGFLLKDVRPADLVAAVRTVASGDAVVSPRVTRRLLEEYARVVPLSASQMQERYPQLATLTEREREVLIAVAGGLSNAEIAASLYVSEATVKSHVGRILAKLGLRDRVQVVVLAYEAGLIQPGADSAPLSGHSWRRRRESNPCTGLCRPLPKPLGHSATKAMPQGHTDPQSGRRDSNPRPSPWQGDALPTEPRPRASVLQHCSRSCRRRKLQPPDPGRRACFDRDRNAAGLPSEDDRTGPFRPGRQCSSRPCSR